MKSNEIFDVIIVGGSYSGLAAAMSLGRALKRVLIIDSGMPCNRQTPHSHNFLTQDGQPPARIAALGREQVLQYDTVRYLEGLAVGGRTIGDGFEIMVASGEMFRARKLVFATGIRDLLPDIEGLSECWGISVLHCPFCHGYEVRGEKTGVLGNGEIGYEVAGLISNWTRDLTLFTNGLSTLTAEQIKTLDKHGIRIADKEIARMEHVDGVLVRLVFRDGSSEAVKAMYTRTLFEQHCNIPEGLGCELTAEGYLRVDAFQQTTVKGVYACGDNVSRLRTVANAVAMGTFTGIAASREFIFENF